MRKKNLQQVENLHHQKVFKCCASCRNKYITENNYRICTLMNIVVEKDMCCKEWEMLYELQQAGISGGVVRKKGPEEIVIR